MSGAEPQRKPRSHCPRSSEHFQLWAVDEPVSLGQGKPEPSDSSQKLGGLFARSFHMLPGIPYFNI